MRRTLIAALLASGAACGSKPSEPAAEPPTRATPAVPDLAEPADPLADASPMPDPTRRADMPSVLVDATLAFSLDWDRVAGHRKAMREQRLLHDLVHRELVDGYPVLEVLMENLIEGGRIEGAIWSTPRHVLADALEIVEKDDGPWAMARAMPAAIVSHVRLELEVEDATRTLARIAALQWEEPRRWTEIPGYDWNYPDACAELPIGTRSAWCLDRVGQVLVAQATAEGIRLDALQFHWPREPLRVVAVEQLARLWPHGTVDLAARIGQARDELIADAGGVGPTLPLRVAAVKAALDKQAATGSALTAEADLVLQIDAARAASYTEGPYLARGIQALMAARLNDRAYQLLTRSPPDREPSTRRPKLPWEGVLPAQLAFESVRIESTWVAEGRRVDLRWKRNPAVRARGDDRVRPQARRAQLCQEATACASVGSRAASLLAVAPVDAATMDPSPISRPDVGAAMLLVAGLWPHVVASAVSGRIPTDAPADASVALAVWAPLGQATPARWGMSIAAADATEARALAAWGDDGSFGRGPVVEVGDLVGHRVAVSGRDAILGVGQRENGHPTGYLASSAGRLAWLAQLPWDAPSTTQPDAFVFVRDIPALIRSMHLWSPPRIFHRMALARLFVEEDEVLLRIELDDRLAVPEVP